MSPGARPTSVPSGIIIHPAVWPQQTWAENWGELCPFWGELGSHLRQRGRGWGLPPCQVSSQSIQPFGHNTPMSQTGQADRTHNGLIAQGKRLYKRSPINNLFLWSYEKLKVPYNSNNSNNNGSFSAVNTARGKQGSKPVLPSVLSTTTLLGGLLPSELKQSM